MNAVVYGRPRGMPARKNEDGELLKQIKDLMVSQQEVLTSLSKKSEVTKGSRASFQLMRLGQISTEQYDAQRKSVTQLQGEILEPRMDNPSVTNATELDILSDYALIQHQQLPSKSL